MPRQSLILVLVRFPSRLPSCSRAIPVVAVSRRILCGPAARPRGITARGDAVRRPFILVSYSILIPNALSSFFSPWLQSFSFRACLLPFWCSTGPGACIRRRALFFEDLWQPGGAPAGYLARGDTGYLAGGDSPGGIAPDQWRTAAGSRAPRDRGPGGGEHGTSFLRLFALVSYSILIPNALSSFFSPRSQSFPFRAGLLPIWCSKGSGACIRGRALFQAAHPRGITGPGGSGMTSIRICCSFFSILVLMSF